jgi:hypothetical protein
MHNMRSAAKIFFCILSALVVIRERQAEEVIEYAFSALNGNNAFAYIDG